MDSEHDLRELLALQNDLRRLALHLGADPALADDLLQELNLIALEPGRTWIRGRAWLGGVLRNLFFNRLREEERRRDRERRSARPEASEEAGGAENGELAALGQALERLEEPYRSTLVARYLEGSSPAELARRSGSPLRTVHTRTSRGLALLRAELSRHRRREARGLALAPTALLRFGIRHRAGVADPPRVTRRAPWIGVRTALASACATLLLAGFLPLWARDARRAGSADAEESPLVARDDARPAPESVDARQRSALRKVVEPFAPASEPEEHVLRLRIRSADGTPLARAHVRLQEHDPNLELGAQEPARLTDDEGLVSFFEPPAGSLLVYVDRAGFVQRIEMPAHGGRELELTLPPGVRVRGRVLTADGTAAVGAEVFAHGEMLEPALVAVCDARGNFEVEGLRPGHGLEARLVGAGRSVLVECLDGGSGDLTPTLRLEPCTWNVAGTVRSSTGRSVRGALVVAYGSSWPRPLTGVPRPIVTRSDERGRFELELPAGPCGLVAYPPRDVPEASSQARLVNRSGDMDVELTLSEPGEVVGSVRGKPGVTAAAHVVCRPLFAAPQSAVRVPQLDVRTTHPLADGSFRISGLAPGSYRLQLQGVGIEALHTLEVRAGLSARWDVDLVSTRELVVALEPLDWSGPLGPGELQEWSMRLYTEDGALRSGLPLGADLRASFVGLEPGSYSVRLFCATGRAEGLDQEIARLEPVFPRAEAWLLRVPEEAFPRAHIAGRLLGPRGEELANEWVSLRAPPGTSPAFARTRTGLDGRFEFGPLRAGPWLLRLPDLFAEELPLPELLHGERLELGEFRPD